jgi:hypothetical protein
MRNAILPQGAKIHFEEGEGEVCYQNPINKEVIHFFSLAYDQAELIKGGNSDMDG